MKKQLFVSAIILLQIISINAQVVSSSEATILINNKPDPGLTKAVPEVVESIMPAAVAASSIVPIGAGKYYALIIGINDYADPDINSLDFCIRDAESFYNAVTSFYTFEKENIKFLKNATMSDIVTSLDYFAQVVKPTDSFLIFYAGHGVWNKTSATVR